MNWLISRLDMIVQQIAAIPRRLWPIGTWANRPDAATFPFAFYFVTDIAGGALFRSNGTRWVPVSACLTLAEQNTDVSVGATTTQTVVSTLALPAGLLGPNDRIECWTNNTRTANTNQSTFRLQLGGTGIDGAIVTARAETGATIAAETVILGFANRNSLSAQCGFGSGGVGGTGTANQITAVDTSVAQNAYYTLQKASAGDTLTANLVSWRLMRGTA